ncbi:UbiH/UbiF/VisC/COQ6 family ubiquinone biosynthesis hydroxylase [Wenxinia saemankumensis]|uniref:2-octaprenyl-6-methoxyphenol hydroxylase /2-octaprenyl-3-methyl-6-methoxy-1,4-benzoquinol hydroxylase n=1 Tax=Wenxinia saemankumensis TaxID=1447782 RepID=A0A1M6FVW8_9RHOB|nr:UbiH/UbiF/VisC/COQ6 family ubiquinone biosynthesis hydroxylase [Wenxinia saemankumensis]SHJ01853.1 2-octaprenyl-6-methoxyphenol hydroxylase /2-octaprenyl-3-methyl-6-methoxy-1,4-benzoquinol hydroxylase [Wenxinia saemankumensis]
MDSDTISDILVVGGGLNGGALALALAGEGFTVTVLDAAPREVRADAGFDGRGYALSVASRRLLDHLGLWDGLEDGAGPITEIRVSDGRAGEGPSPFALQFEAAEIEEGPMGHVVEDRHLRPALLDAMDAHPRVTHRGGVRVTGQEIGPAGVTVALEGGERLAGRLLVGADGRATGVGRRAGIGRMEWGYGQRAVVCAVSHARPHGGVAHQFFMPGGPLAILPLAGDRSSIVWSEEARRAEALMGMDDEAFLAALRPAFGSHLGEIALEGRRFSYPLGLSLAHRFVAARVALVGDAAHGVHPIAGQGLNAGLKDVAALAEVLGEARQSGEDIGAAAVLARYERWRRFDTATLALATDGFNRLFSNDNPLLRGIRDLGLGAVNALPGLRRGFIREAAGLTGELPRLMR